MLPAIRLWVRTALTASATEGATEQETDGMAPEARMDGAADRVPVAHAEADAPEIRVAPVPAVPVAECWTGTSVS